MTGADFAHRIGVVLGRPVVASRPLRGGCVADVRAVELADGSRCVVKVASAGGLKVEGWMLRYLAEHTRLPVPAVLYAEDEMLVLEEVPCDDGGIGPAGEREAADHLAALHEVTAPRFGLARDTVIGGLPQPNAWSRRWVEFLRDRRLMFMGRCALEKAAISAACFARLERLCDRLEDWIAEPTAASLVHGDVWAGNVLLCRGRVAAFVDPAIYFADPEIELAFVTLFSTFGEEFFRRYHEHRPVAAGFFESRRDIYNLYPLLVHAVLFAGGYGASVDLTLRRLIG